MARLIIVEDNHELASLIAAAARSRGHIVLAAHTSQAALEALSLQTADAAIVDLLLPDGNGNEILDALKAQSIPAIAISGVFKGSRFATESTEVHGAKAFFEKPFELEALLAALDHALGGPVLPGGLDEQADEDALEELSPIEDDNEPLILPAIEPRPGPPVEAVTPPPPPPEALQDHEAFASVPPLPPDEVDDVPTREMAPPPPEDDERPTAVYPAPPNLGADLPDEPLVATPAEEALEAAARISAALDEPPPPPVDADALSEAPAEPPVRTAAQAPPPMDPEEAEVAEAFAALTRGDDEPPTQPPLPPRDAEVSARAPAPALMPVESPAELRALDALDEAAPRSELSSREAPLLGEPAALAAPPEQAPRASEADSAETHVLPFAQRGQVWTESAPPAAKPASAPVAENQAGDLHTSSVPRLLTAYYQARHTGELKLRQGNVVKVVYFQKGQPIYAASNVAQERFGRFCVRKGVLTAEQLEEVARLAKEQNLRTAEAMIRLERLTPEQRVKLLEEQVREIIWSTFGWTQGEFSFVPKRPSAAGLVKLSVFPGNLIMEGVQRSETLVSLRKKLPGSRRYAPTADPPYELHEITLSGAQALLLAYADGTKTVEDLVALSDLPERDTLATLAGLELMGLLAERRDEGRSRRISFGL